MNVWRTISNKLRVQAMGILLLLAFGPALAANQKQGKGPKITDKTFRQTSFLLLDDPLSKSARDRSRLIMLYTLDTPNAAVVLDQEELRWAAVDRSDRHSLLLLAAYVAGNIQSQLNSGVKRNDRYSGLLTLFRVYRALREQDDKFKKIDAVDDLLALHEEGKLTPHLQKLEKKNAAKWTPAVEAMVRRLMQTR